MISFLTIYGTTAFFYCANIVHVTQYKDHSSYGDYCVVSTQVKDKSYSASIKESCVMILKKCNIKEKK